MRESVPKLLRVDEASCRLCDSVQLFTSVLAFSCFPFLDGVRVSRFFYEFPNLFGNAAQVSTFCT